MEASLDIWLWIPKALSKDAGFLDDFLVEGASVAELVPHAGCATNHVDIGHLGIEAVGSLPVLEGPWRFAVEIAVANVEVSLVVSGENDWILPACKLAERVAFSPPLNHIVLVNWQVDFRVCPVDDFLLRWDRPPSFLLRLPEVDSQLIIWSDVVLPHPYLDGLSFCPAVFVDLVASEVHVIVDEGWVHVFQDAGDHFPSHV